MKQFYLVKKSVTRAPLKPKEKITLEEYQEFIDRHASFTWLENTEHGKKWNKVRPVKKRLRAYLNYDPEDEWVFIQEFEYSIDAGEPVYIAPNILELIRNLQFYVEGKTDRLMVV